MLVNKSNFKLGRYIKNTNIFVLVGESNPIPVTGYGADHIKLDGNKHVLENCLHVSSLECSLFLRQRGL